MPSELITIFERTGELKRIPSAVGPSSVAGGIFLETTKLVVAAPPSADHADIFDWMVIKSLAGAVIGDWGVDSVAALGWETWREMTKKALGYTLSLGPAQLRGYYEERFAELWQLFHQGSPVSHAGADKWLKAVYATPRAGYAAVQQTKCIPYPRESQAEHSLVSAVYAALLARLRQVDVTQVCLMALLHHLTAPLLPNVDHEVEQIIGDDERQRIETRALEFILNDFPTPARENIRQALEAFSHGSDDAGRSIVLEADVLDRVLQVRYYEKIARLNVKTAIREYELLNRGALEAFQREILRAYDLI